MNCYQNNMLIKSISVILLGLSCIAQPAIAVEITPEVCTKIQKEKGAAAYLIDQSGNLSKGPIDFGRIAYKYSKRDSYIIPTNFRLIVTPARLELDSCSEGCMVLSNVAPVCKNSKTYSIGFAMRDDPRSDSDRSWLPWKEDRPTNVFIVVDPESDNVNLRYRFDARIVGEIYDPRKQ
jgi:hypothetical protein